MKRWEVLADLIQRGQDCRSYRTYCEVGCKEGRTTAYILRHCPDVHITAIDPWVSQPEQADKEGGETYEQWDFGEIERIFRKNIEGFENRVTLEKRFGYEVALRTPDASLDVIFIDAAHDFMSLVEDITRWLPKVKPGGILAGHDYNHKWPSVNRAVASCFNLMQMQLGPDSVWWVQA